MLEWFVDAPCVYDHQAFGDTLLLYFECEDPSANAHTLVLSVELSPPVPLDLTEGEPVQLLHHSTQPSTATATVIRGADQAIRLAVLEGPSLDFPGVPDAFDPFLFSVSNTSCPEESGCGGPTRAQLVAASAGVEIAVFDHQQATLPVADDLYTLTVEGAVQRTSEEACPFEWDVLVRAVLARQESG